MSSQFVLSLATSNGSKVPGLPSASDVNCTFQNAILTPLFDPHQNTINPCFISSVNLVYNSIFAVFALCQLYSLIYQNSYGPYKIKHAFGSAFNAKSVGILQVIKINSLFLQVLLYISLLDFFRPFSFQNVTSLNALVSLAALVVFLPLQIIEPTRTVVSSVTPLAFWIGSTVFTGAIALQDTFSEQKVWIPVGSSASVVSIIHTLEGFLFFNSLAVFILQFWFYHPSIELKQYWDLNDWDVAAVHDFFTDVGMFNFQSFIGFAYSADEVHFKDVPATHINLTSKLTLDHFDSYWNPAVAKAEKKREQKLKKIAKPTEKDKELPKISLFLLIVRIHWRTIIAAVTWDMLELVLTFGQTYFLQRFIGFFSESAVVEDEQKPRRPAIVGIAFAFGILFSSTLRSICFNRWFMSNFHSRVKINTSLTAKIYQKSLKLSPEARKLRPTGDIITNLSVDAPTVANSIQTMIEIGIMPPRLIGSLWALSKLLGRSTIAGVIASIVLIPCSSLISSATSSLYNKDMKIKDSRTRLTSEIMNSIKSIKLFSWEEPILKRLFVIRNEKELPLAKKIGLYNSFASFTWLCIPFIVACSCFFTFAIIEKAPLVPTIIFPAMTLFEVITEPILMIPNLFSDSVETNVSLKRLRELFTLEEIEDNIVERKFDALKKDDLSIKVENATFLWKAQNKLPTNDEENDLTSTDIALKDINFTAKKGRLTCIVGKVGSGKSTLIKSLLGEVSILQNPATTLSVTGTLAYCAQSPWLANATVKENILFGCKYEKEFYEKTVKACQLLPDFDIFPDGERTVVGEKGISLSGGQKARVSLARAVYSRADVLLLDDILSAVDSHVGKNIVDEVLGQKGILASKTIVLATNSVNVLHQSDLIYLLRKGEIVQTGNYKDIVKGDSELAKLIEEFGTNEDVTETVPPVVSHPVSESAIEDESSSQEIVEYQPTDAGDIDEEERETPLDRVISRATVRRASFVSLNHDYENDESPDVIKRTGQLEEKRAKGEVKLSVYLDYFKACNFYYVIYYVFTYGVFFATTIYSQYVLKTWSEKNLGAGHNIQTVFYLGVYAFLGFIGGLATLSGNFIVWCYCVISGSKYFHDTMAKAVVNSPMSFFETTPIGRIINRFSDDINIIDQQLIWSFMGVVEYALQGIGVILVLVFNLPAMIIVVILLGILFNQLRKYFIASSRELKRLQSAYKSPVFSHLQESLNGVDTIRAHGQETRFIHRNRKNVDNLAQITFNNLCCNRWLSLRLQLISAVISFSVAVFILSTLGTSRQLSPGFVGFIMVNAMGIITTFNAIIRYWADVENKSVSVERIIEYCHLPSEAASIVEDNRPPASWPEKGAIKFVDYTTKYRDNLDPVLKNISIEIKAGEKIGIVGRTGAGKSTLSLALFRIIEATGGHIEIDGIDTSKIGLSDLRRKLNIIPQDSHAIEGSVRQNLDPFSQYTDDQLWKVLELASLKEHVEGMKNKKKTDDDDDDEDEDKDDKKSDDDDTVEWETQLSAQVFEGGSNLSSGQRQLLSLARALLNPSQVLVLDEATAAVDAQTDKIIQKTIRSEFSEKTILTIAHRLETVLDSDRVLVLGAGEIKEFDTPKNLLSDESTIFYSLCKEGGYLKDLDISKL